MNRITRCFAVAVAVVAASYCSVPVARAQAELPRAGEIMLSGDVVSVDAPGHSLVIRASKFTLPSAKSGAIAPPKDKIVTVGADTFIHAAGQTERATLDKIVAGTADAPVTATVTGADAGSGKPLAAREIIVAALVKDTVTPAVAPPTAENQPVTPKVKGYAITEWVSDRTFRIMGVNDSGQISGTAPVAGTAFGARTALYINKEIKDLGTLGGLYSQPNDMNKAGQLVGMSGIAGGNQRTGGTHPFLYSDGQMKRLGTLPGSAMAINEAGQVIGIFEVGNDKYSAFLYSDGKLQDLGSLGGDFTIASGINAKGQIVGRSKTADGKVHAFLYSDGKMQDLGEGISANDINDVGQIIGTRTTADGKIHAFVYHNGQMKDIGTLTQVPEGLLPVPSITRGKSLAMALLLITSHTLIFTAMDKCRT